MLENEKQLRRHRAGRRRARGFALAYLADDAIIFEPGPVNAKKVWTGRAPKAPLSLNGNRLSRDGAQLRSRFHDRARPNGGRDKNDEKPLGYGHYISIWKKQKDGTWKVVLDVGGAFHRQRKVEDLARISISGHRAAARSRRPRRRNCAPRKSGSWTPRKSIPPRR